MGVKRVYRVDDDVALVTVIGVGKPDKQKAYETAQAGPRPAIPEN